MFSFNPLAYLFGGSTIALAVALGGVTISKNATIRELRGTIERVTHERDTARSDLVTARVNNTQLEANIRDQNSQIDALRLRGEARQKLLDGLRKDSEVQTRSRSILDRKGQTCEDADKLILELVR